MSPDQHKNGFNETSLKLLDELYNISKFDATDDRIDRILSDFKVLTREKTLNDEVLSERCLTTLIKYSKGCHLEAQKCISNLILNYDKIREKFTDPYVRIVEERLNDIKQPEPTGETTAKETSTSQAESDQITASSKEQFHEVLYYDLRIIFLLSALSQLSRNTITEHLLTPLLEFTSMQSDRFSHENCPLILEAIKTLFNLTLNKSPSCKNSLIVCVIKKILAIVDNTDNNPTASVEEKSDSELLLVNVIHLLTNMNEDVYKTLSDGDVDKVLNHLDHQLKVYSKQNLRETVLPVMNVCANICKFNEQVRLRWSQSVIESSKEFDKRPEEYRTFRGRLVKLMTSVDIHIKDIAAEFVYNLCGRNTEKFITYTGLGNSAAFLTSRGLLAGPSSSRNNEDIEFQELRDKINPITGRIEEFKENPMDNMTEEEKEYHACQLANAITRLSNLGVVKPMQIDGDGIVSDLHPLQTKHPEGDDENGDESC